LRCSDSAEFVTLSKNKLMFIKKKTKKGLYLEIRRSFKTKNIPYYTIPYHFIFNKNL